MPSQPDEKDYEEKKVLLCVLTLLSLGGYIDLRYGDESSFNLEPNVPYGWIKKGENQEIPSRKGGNLNVFGLLNLAGELTSYQTTQKVDSQMVISWIDDFASTIQKQTIIVLDNAPWHKSKVFMDRIERWEELGLFIVYLPTYSPHLNPTEILWRRMKYDWLKPQDYLTKEDLHNAIKHILKNYNNDEFSIDFKTDFNC